MSGNPFAALLGLPNESEELQESNTTSSNKGEINKIIEDIFLITLNEEHEDENRQLVLLKELLENSGNILIDLDLLEQAIFERILLDVPEDYVVPKSNHVNQTVCEKKVVTYLHECYVRLKEFHCSEEIKKVATSLIIRNVILALQQPDLFVKQDISKQFLEIIKDVSMSHEEFFILISNDFNPQDDINLTEAFSNLAKLVHMDIMKSALVNIYSYIYSFFDIFTCNESYANVLLDLCYPKVEVGNVFGFTLIGGLLNLSILPKTFDGRYEYFDKPLDQASNIVENNLWTSTTVLNDQIHNIFLRLLKCSKNVRKRTLKWLGLCLKNNAGRGKLWNTQQLDFDSGMIINVSDGFMINLTYVILRLCQPFCLNIESGKILKVDPTYCAVPEEECENKEVHMFKLATETCLIPASDDEDSSNATRPIADSYSFVTECFYLAHRSLDLGFRVCVDNLVTLNQDIGQMQRAYSDAVTQTLGNSDVIDAIKQRLENTLTRYRSLRAVLLEPNIVRMLSQFHMATAIWLVQVCVNMDPPENTSTYAPLKFRNVTFPLPNAVPATLKCIPEFLIENIVGYLSFLRRFNPQTLEEQGYEFLESILTMVLIFMGSSQRMRNPHLRARMAECLEALLPYHKDVPPEMNPLGRFQRERLFKEHPFRKEIVPNLLDVFVEIEMTGQSVQFEQKFNYRRPMYIVMDYLWQLEEHKQYFKELALDAEANMEAVTPPLFLRFVNLLMNDAIFLLDESLSNMAQLRTMQAARENGEWNSLPHEERTQNMASMMHTGMIARFDNILGRETIHTLELLTSEISTVFTHATMVDRVAAMLNYFLFNLVGPNKKNFKVKDLKEYEFDPANIVLDICKIYVHLYENDAFCLAISQDGRSYSPQLFYLAEDVLARIGGGSLISELKQVALKVSQMASQQKAEEEALAEAPDEFLDPIMSTLMTDPVILPSSKQIVDRTTIARHLLSDQTDPFNRSPLTMDQVLPHTELAERIKAWIKEKHKKNSRV